MSEARIVVYGLDIASNTYRPLTVTADGVVAVDIESYSGNQIMFANQTNPQIRREDGVFDANVLMPASFAIQQNFVSGAYNLGPLNALTNPPFDWPQLTNSPSSGQIALITAGAGTDDSDVFFNFNWRGGVFQVRGDTVGAATTVSILGVYGPIGAALNILTYTILTTAVLAAGTPVILRVYPGLTAVANLTVNDILPSRFMLRMNTDAASDVRVTFNLSL